MAKPQEQLKVNALLQNSKTLYNVSTRLKKHLLEVFACDVQFKKVGDLFYIVVLVDDKALYSYYVENEFFSAYLGAPEDKDLLIDNDPTKSCSRKHLKSHKWMFENIVQHWYDVHKETQTA